MLVSYLLVCFYFGFDYSVLIMDISIFVYNGGWFIRLLWYYENIV